MHVNPLPGLRLDVTGEAFRVGECLADALREIPERRVVAVAAAIGEVGGADDGEDGTAEGGGGGEGGDERAGFAEGHGLFGGFRGEEGSWREAAGGEEELVGGTG